MNLLCRTPGFVAFIFAAVSMVTGAEPVKPPQSQVPPLTDKPKVVGTEDPALFADIVRKIEATMVVKATVPQARDPDGRIGIFIDSGRPFLTPPQTPGMDIRKTWVLLATFSALSAMEGTPVLIDYIGFTDPEGANGKRWFFQLNIKDALRIQKAVFAGDLTMEQGYEQIIAAWKKVTRT